MVEGGGAGGGVRGGGGCRLQVDGWGEGGSNLAADNTSRKVSTS